MTTIKITTSVSTTIVQVMSPLDDVVEIEYGDCQYCGLPFRKNPRGSNHRFHDEKCRKLYFALGIGELETPRRLMPALSHR